jgi:glycosyltransferase involved in cell wall biosynthesis
MIISVALCTYNGGRFLEEQLESILNQTLSIDEIIICDDNSSDNTKDIIKEFQEKYPNKINLHFNKHNLKVNKNFEKAISLCSGDYIFLSDQDDIWVPNKAEKIISIFEKNPEFEGVFSDGNLITEFGELFTEKSLWDNVLFFEKNINTKIDLFYYISNIRNMVTGATLCIKKEVKQFIFPFPNQKLIYHDEWISLLLAFRKKITFTNDKLISYRIHSAQQVGIIKSSSQKRNLKLIQSVLNIENTHQFKDLFYIRKLMFRNYFKFIKLKNSMENHKILNYDIIIDSIHINIIEIERRMKKCNCLFYIISILADKITNKRQLKL